jgi:RelA/SpoT family protein
VGSSARVNGYRAVHVIIPSAGKLIEVQVRTSLQHLWAELSEKLSDIVDSAIKYGGGDEDAVKILMVMSNTIKAQEANESRLLVDNPQGNLDEIHPEDLRADIANQRAEIAHILDAIGEIIPRLKGRKN